MTSFQGLWSFPKLGRARRPTERSPVSESSSQQRRRRRKRVHRQRRQLRRFRSTIRSGQSICSF